MTHPALRARGSLLVAGVLGLTMLSGCAPLAAAPSATAPSATAPSATASTAAAGWHPLEWEVKPGVELVGFAPEPTTESDGAAPPPPGGLIEGRIRNDGIGFAARYVELPMRHPFNDRMKSLLKQAVSDAGGAYQPEVHPAAAGLADRGCVPGSLAWSADRVLSDPATALEGGSGTVITCELLGEYGDTVEVGVRVVSGEAGAAIRDDHTVRLYADVTHGTLSESVPQWNDVAPVELWGDVVEQLRRSHGALSTAPLADPNEEQVQLVAGALEAARHVADQELRVILPPGITSPELDALGVAPTSEALEVRLAPDIWAPWVSAEMAPLIAQRAMPFVGLPAWNAALPVDCGFVPCVAVTYDDGPSEFTPKLLDTLRDQHAAATFFQLGNAAQRFPDIAARAAAEGHEVESHTMRHPDLTTLTPEKAKDEVLDAVKAVTQITGTQVTCFRPPYGAINDEVLKEVKIPAVLWSIDTNDWREPGRDELIERSATVAQPGDIILFHDTHGATVDAAADVITALKNRGYSLVTVKQLFDGSIPTGKVFRR